MKTLEEIKEILTNLQKGIKEKYKAEVIGIKGQRCLNLLVLPSFLKRHLGLRKLMLFPMIL